MKSTLLKTLVTLGLVLGLSACGGGKKPSESSESEPEAPVTITLAAAWEREAEPDDEGNYPYANVGKNVIIKDLAVCGLYGNTYVLNQNHAAPSKYSDFSGIEVELKEGTTSTAWVYDRCTVSGKLTAVEERLVIVDGELEITTPAWKLNEDGTRTRLTDADGKNIGSIYYVKADSRAIFNNVTAPLNSGALADIYVQFVTVPSGFSTEKGASFYVVYPGENTDADVANNESLIEVRIPAGLPQRAIDRFNDYLNPAEGEAVKPGDFAIITGCLQYHTFSQGLVMEYFFSGFEAFAE